MKTWLAIRLLPLGLCACDAPPPVSATAALPAVDLLQGLQAPAAFSYRRSGMRDPFANTAPVAAIVSTTPRRADSLDNVRAQQLRWLGRIVIGEHDYALLQTPDGGVHRAGLHQRIGSDKNEIIAIDAFGLQLRGVRGEQRLSSSTQTEALR